MLENFVKLVTSENIVNTINTVLQLLVLLYLPYFFKLTFYWWLVGVTLAVAFGFFSQIFGIWWGPTNGILSLYECRFSGGIPWGDENIQNLPYSKELVWTFLLWQVVVMHHSCLTQLVKLSLFLSLYLTYIPTISFLKCLIINISIICVLIFCTSIDLW